MLPILKPGHDHCIDSLRYAVEEIWRDNRGGQVATAFTADILGL